MATNPHRHSRTGHPQSIVVDEPKIVFPLPQGKEIKASALQGLAKQFGVGVGVLVNSIRNNKPLTPINTAVQPGGKLSKVA